MYLSVDAPSRALIPSLNPHFQILSPLKMENLKSLSPYRLSSLLRLQPNPNLALQLFQNPNSSPKPFRYSRLSYDLIISKLGRAKMFDQMEQIIDQMRLETRFSPKEVLFCNVISFYGRSRMSEPAHRIYDRIPSFNCQRTVKSFNSLLNALLNCRDFNKIREIYVNLDQHAVPDACTYNILIRACCLNGSLDDAWNMFYEMRSKGIRATVVTFGTLISALCTDSKLDEAFRLKDEMSTVLGIKPSVFIYTSLIKGLCGSNDLDLAFKLKNDMFNEKLELDSAVYSTLISALFRAGRRGEVVDILKEMKEIGCKPDTVTYNAIISGLCAEKDFISALGVLDEMIEKGNKPDVVTHNIILSGYCKEGRLKEARDLFEDMPRRECFPDIVSYRTLFDALCDGMEFKEAAFILDEMLFKGFVPRIASAQKLAKGLCSGVDVKLLASVLYSLAKVNTVDVDIWTMVTSFVCKNSIPLKEWEFFDAVAVS